MRRTRVQTSSDHCVQERPCAVCWQFRTSSQSKGSIVSLVRLLARPMLASAYIANGISRVKNPQASASSIAPILGLVKNRVDVPLSPELAARVTGGAQVAAGALLAIGRFPRISSSILVGTYLIDVVGEQLSRKDSDETGTAKSPSILTKTSLLGGALLASVDTAGRPGLVWRAQHAAADIRDAVERNTAKAIDAVTPN